MQVQYAPQLVKQLFLKKISIKFCSIIFFLGDCTDRVGDLVHTDSDIADLVNGSGMPCENIQVNL